MRSAPRAIDTIVKLPYYVNARELGAGGNNEPAPVVKIEKEE